MGTPSPRRTVELKQKAVELYGCLAGFCRYPEDPGSSSPRYKSIRWRTMLLIDL